jgi:predicted transport protein
MPLFHIDKNKMTTSKPINFYTEKELQTLIENNLEVVFNCRFIESEFPTGSEHGGRIDTLALSKNNNPVIIEYKIIASSQLVNQSLYYLSWIKDHKGDFQVAVNKKLGKNIKINWNDIRVICIAPEYKKFDLHAVKTMGANIELWQYKRYDTNSLYLEEISTALMSPDKPKKPPQPRQTYTFKWHLNKCDDELKTILLDLREFILNIGEAVEEAPFKYGIAYKVSQNFVRIKTSKNKLLLLLLKVNPKEIKIPKNGRRSPRGNLILSINNAKEMKESKKYIKMAFKNTGG